jgi:hypothetical protein
MNALILSEILADGSSPVAPSELLESYNTAQIDNLEGLEAVRKLFTKLMGQEVQPAASSSKRMPQTSGTWMREDAKAARGFFATDLKVSDFQPSLLIIGFRNRIPEQDSVGNPRAADFPQFLAREKTMNLKDTL